MNGGTTLEDARLALCDAGVSTLLSESGRSLLLLTRTDNAKLSAEIVVDQDCGSLAAAAIYPFLIPEPRRAEVAAYVAAANPYERVGGFRFEPTSGDLSYEVASLFEERGFSEGWVARVTRMALSRLDAHLEALGGVVFGGIGAADALDAVYRFDLDDVLDQASGEL